MKRARRVGAAAWRFLCRWQWVVWLAGTIWNVVRGDARNEICIPLNRAFKFSAEWGVEDYARAYGGTDD